jgi:hypothetical protein
MTPSSTIPRPGLASSKIELLAFAKKAISDVAELTAKRKELQKLVQERKANPDHG